MSPDKIFKTLVDEVVPTTLTKAQTVEFQQWLLAPQTVKLLSALQEAKSQFTEAAISLGVNANLKEAEAYLYYADAVNRIIKVLTQEKAK